MSISCPLSNRDYSSLPALHTQDKVYTYSDLDALVSRYSSALSSFFPADKIAFIAHFSPETIALFFALFRKKLIACPLSFRLPLDALTNSLKRLNAILLDPHSLPLNQTSPEKEIILDQIATALFTSGTTGTPKIALHTFASHYYSAQGAVPFFDLHPGDRWRLSLPLHHVGGLAILFRCFLAGGAVDLTDRFPTHLSLVPTQLFRLLQQPLQQENQNLKLLLIGGAPLPDPLLQKAHHYNLPIATSYGLTETSSLVTLCKNPKQGHEIGGALPNRNLSLIDGEFVVSGKTLFAGYLNEKPLEKFRTKDLGSLEKNSYFFLGRKDNLIISGGENIQPEEIERALQQYPGIERAVVRPISSAEYGHRPIAYLSPSSILEETEKIKKYLVTSLPKYKIPDHFFPFSSHFEKNEKADT